MTILVDTDKLNYFHVMADNQQTANFLNKLQTKH